VWMVAAAIAAGWWRAARVVWRHTDVAAALGATMTAATLVVALAVLVPPVANVTTAKDLAETINRSGRFPPELWMVEERSGSLVFYLDSALRRDLTRERVLQLYSPLLERYVHLQGQPFEPAGHYRMYDGVRLLHTDAPANRQPVPAHAPHHRP
jgi:hypothetical protein